MTTVATTTETTVGAVHVADTTPYPWPWDGVLDAVRTAVLLVEAPGAQPSAEQLHNAAVVVATVRGAGGRAARVITRPPARGRPAEPAGTAAIPADETLVARGVDGFYGSALEHWLRRAGVDRLLLTGSWLETSVHSTMRSANDMGFECLLVVDACTPGDPDLVPASVSMVEMSGGIFGAVGTTARVVDAYAAGAASASADTEGELA